MIERHYGQRQIAEGFFNAPIEDWWEPWMKRADEILDDEELIDTVYEALRRRHPQSATRGRMGTPAEIVIRLMVLKHVRGWSYETLEREVRANMVYRITRIGAEKVPDAKTMGRLGQALGPDVVEQVHARIVGIAREKKIVPGRRLRVDTTVVETNIHYPTDSSLLGDGVRVLTRTMQRLSSMVKTTTGKIRNRMRSTSRRVMEIARASRSRGKGVEEKRKRSYQRLFTITGQVVRQAERTSRAIAETKRRPKRVRQLQQELDRMIGLVRQVMKQAKARIFTGDTHFTDKLVSVFEPQTEVIRKGKTSKPTEFGKMVKIQEAENQIITSYAVYEKRPNDSDLLVKAVEEHCNRLGQVPDLVAADAAFHSPTHKAAIQKMGVKHISVPNRPTKDPALRKIQKTRWFRKGQKWRTGSEGRISVLKRRHGLDRCRYRGHHGMGRWVGLGVIADNLINIGRVLAAQA